VNLWLFGFILFFLPQGIAVIERSSRYLQEGGICWWSKGKLSFLIPD